jgi:N,N'-diacetylchitobiose transport system permease protein
VEWDFLFAGATLVTLPVLILFLVLQRWLAAGLVGGAIKT